MVSAVPLLPGANSPQLLTRLLEAVSRGVRTTRGLQEALGIGVQTVRAYVHAGAWLGLVDATDPVELSPLGLEYVYAGPRRPMVYARAVWSNALAADLLVASDGRVPEVSAVERAILRTEPGLAEATVRRRASAVRGLIAPAVGRPRPRSREEEERQLALPLDHASTVEPPPAGPRVAAEHDPELYRHVLACLLDHGELSVGHLRALLDRAGATSVGPGGVMDLLASRGDAVRVAERFVASRGAVARRELADSAAGVVLSDPGWRAWAMAPVRRVVKDAARHRGWTRRLLGRAVEDEDLAGELDALLPDRPLAAFPVAEPAQEELPIVAEPFLDAWERPGLRIALPPSLAQLQGGVSAVNRLLQQARLGGGVSLPDAADRPVAVHGGLVHPGEPLPRTVPDARTLRQRVLMHVPYAAVTAAILLLHRLSGDRVAVVDEGDGWRVRGAGEPGAPLLDWIDAFALGRQWLPIRRGGHGLPPRAFVGMLESVGVASVVGRVLVLAEPLFARLQSEAEELEIHARLMPLCDAVEAAIEAEGA